MRLNADTTWASGATKNGPTCGSTNPVCKRAPHLPIGCGLEDDRNQVVGSIGDVPFGFELDGQPLIAGTSSGWVVEERYRAYALLLLDRFLSQPEVDLHLGVSPNAQSEPAVALQSERVPVGIWNRVAFWITDPWAFVGSALAKREARYRRLLRYPIWAAVVLHRAFKRDRVRAALHDEATSTMSEPAAHSMTGLMIFRPR